MKDIRGLGSGCKDTKQFSDVAIKKVKSAFADFTFVFLAFALKELKEIVQVFFLRQSQKSSNYLVNVVNRRKSMVCKKRTLVKFTFILIT